MAVKIRLKRMGSNKKPFYRIVVADSRSPRDVKWLSNGAQPTDTVKTLLVNNGVMEKFEASKK